MQIESFSLKKIEKDVMIILDYDRRMCMLGTIIGTNDNQVLIKLNKRG